VVRDSGLTVQGYTFADSEFNGKRRKTRKEGFFTRMEVVLPWSTILGVIKPVYSKTGNSRRPYPLDTMLRIHYMQQWYNRQRRRHERCSLRDYLHTSVCPTLSGPGHP
jgi:hypothetical protein